LGVFGEAGVAANHDDDVLGHVCASLSSGIAEIGSHSAALEGSQAAVPGILRRLCVDGKPARPPSFDFGDALLDCAPCPPLSERPEGAA